MSSILNKIKALLAKAASTSNAHEAQAFAEKANELMEKYQIDVDAIRSSDDPVGKDNSYEGKTGGWRQSLSCATAHYYGCRAVITRDHGGVLRVSIFGRESARITALAMFPYLLKTVNAMSRDMEMKTGRNKRTCANEIGMELSLRLRRLAPKMETANAATTGKNALIRLDEVNMMVELHFPHLRQRSKASFKSSLMARDYANSVGLSSQVGRGSALAIGSR